MLQELFVSVVSGVIVAILLSLFGSRESQAARQQMRSPTTPPPQRWQQSQPQVQGVPHRKRGTFIGGLFRFIFAVMGGIGLAYVAAHAMHLRHIHGMGRADGITAHSPLLLLTVIGTIFVWLLLSALARR